MRGEGTVHGARWRPRGLHPLPHPSSHLLRCFEVTGGRPLAKKAAGRPWELNRNSLLGKLNSKVDEFFEFTDLAVSTDLDVEDRVAQLRSLMDSGDVVSMAGFEFKANADFMHAIKC